MKSRVLYTCLYLLFFYLYSCDYGYKKDLKKDFFTGKIQKIYQDDNNHGMIMIKIIENNNDSNLIISDCWSNLWKYAEVGDSIIKPPDTLIIILKKQNGKQMIFNYDW